MRTIRGRLTVGYAIALATTMFVFAAAILFLQTPEPFGDIDDRLRVEAELIANIILESWESGPVLETESASGREVLAPRVSNLFQSVDDYVVAVGLRGDPIFAAAPRAPVSGVGDTIFTVGVPQDREGQAELASVFETLAALVSRSEDQPASGTVRAVGSPGNLRYFVRPIIRGPDPGPGVSGIVTATPTGGLALGPGRILGGVLLSAPFILVASISIGYLLAGRILAPVDEIIDEIEAITDGRSLHRRVAGAESTEELARLTSTLNNMLIRLERSFLSLRRFTADASHELKTPLTVLRSGVERAITHPQAPPSVLEVLEETLIEVNRMTELVDSLLMLARTDEGRAPLHLERADIRDLLGEIAETASILAEQSSVDVSVEIPTRPMKMAIDRSRIRQLFMNLLSNAVKYTPRGGSVAIGCRKTDRDVVFTVTDTGIGIAAGELPYIFDRFWRADVARSRTGQRPGVGLGLAICKWIAEAHGGSISAKSKRGKGTTFTVTLPVGD